MTLEETAYLAGLLEGEGYFGINHGSPTITLQMTDEDIVQRAKSIIGGGTIIKYPSKLGHKILFMLQVHSIKALEVMKSIRPLMGLRRGQKIDDVINECEFKITNMSEGKCKRGHSPTFYHVNPKTGRKTCKLCQKVTLWRSKLKVVNED